ncbi:VOC family protein [bacterium]|nr:VOC family protein [bacterium]
MGMPVVHFEITGHDGAKLQSFYSTLFGWKIDASNPMQYGLVAAEEKSIGGGISGTEPGGSPRVTVYIGVDKIDPVLGHAEKLGGKTVMPRTVIPGMVVMALFADPSGNVIGLVENEMPPA